MVRACPTCPGGANRTPNPDRTGRAPNRGVLSVRVSRRTVTDDEQADGVLWDQSGKLSSKGARLLRGHGKTLGTIDLHVASRVRERRIVLGISQRQMATTLGLTFQQVHKYEQVISRISAGRLYDFGKVLGVTITLFC